MRIFTDDGDAIPVTVLDVSNNRVAQVKTAATDGYSRPPGRLRRAEGLPRHQARSRPPRQGRRRRRRADAGIPRRRRPSPPSTSRARRCRSACSPSASWSTCRAPRSARASPARSSATTSSRSARRTATAVRTTCRARSRWRRTRAACSRARRCRASSATSPRTTQNLDIVRIDEARQLLLVRGAVPGAKNGHVVVRPAVKAPPKGAPPRLPRREPH